MTTSPPRLADSADARQALGRAQVLYTDLDGTLLGRGGSLVTDYEGRADATAATAVALVNSQSLPVVMISGRNVKQLRELARLLSWRDYIAEVGCVRVVDRSAEVTYNLGDWTPGLVEETGATPYEIIERTGAVAALMRAFPGKIEYHEPYHVDRLVTHALRGEVDLPAAQSILDSFTLPMAIVDNGIIHPLRHDLTGVGTIHAYHVMPRGVAKVHAIAADLEARGLTSADAVVVGDSVTDLAIAPGVALMVLVRNALDQHGMAEAAAAYDNVVVASRDAGHGWSELVRAWLDARADVSCGVE